jgi:rod shape-determining protein MreC
LGALVVLSLILLTAYFGESSGGALHGVQRGFLTVVSPIQDGASKALTPVRDGVDWFGEVIGARGERNKLRKEVDKLRGRQVAEAEQLRHGSELEAIYKLEGATGLSEYTGVTANVIAQPANVWYQTVNIDKGSSAGIAIDDPVFDGEGLVGLVTDVEPDAAQVSLITDSEVAVSARIMGTRKVGIVQPKVGDPEDLLMQYGPRATEVTTGKLVVTSGTVEAQHMSLYPPNIPIGKVTSISEESAYETINVRPTAQLHGLGIVRVLTHGSGSRIGRISSQIAEMPTGGQGGGEQQAPPGTGYAQTAGGE